MNQEVYILSPVRQVTEEQAEIIAAHVQAVKAVGDIVFNPIENAPQDDPTGYYIVMTELKALSNAAKKGGRVDILWNIGGKPSEGSRVDLGIAVALGLERRLVAVFNEDEPTGPQVAYEIILGNSDRIQQMQNLLNDIEESGELVIDWDIEMVTDRQEWQRIRLGLALGVLARNPDLRIRLGNLVGIDPPDKKSYPKVINEIEKRQSV